MLKTQINNKLDNPNINRSNVISFLDFKHRKAEVLDRLLKYDEAMEAYNKAIELKPDDAGAYP